MVGQAERTSSSHSISLDHSFPLCPGSGQTREESQKDASATPGHGVGGKYADLREGRMRGREQSGPHTVIGLQEFQPLPSQLSERKLLFLFGVVDQLGLEVRSD